MPVEQALTQAAQSVLEMMFFAGTEPGSPAAGLAELQVEVRFDGLRRGALILEMPERCARAMAASFAGVPEAEALPQEAVHQVAAELSNMICGATLARVEPNGLFKLSAPLVRPAAGRAALEPEPSECWLQIPAMENGLLHLALILMENA